MHGPRKWLGEAPAAALGLAVVLVARVPADAASAPASEPARSVSAALPSPTTPIDVTTPAATSSPIASAPPVATSSPVASSSPVATATPVIAATPGVVMTPLGVPDVDASPTGTPVPIALPSAYPLVVPPPGFRQIRNDGGLTGAWLEVVSAQTHAVFIASTTNPAFATIGTDLDRYVPRIVRQIERDRDTVIVSKGKKTICHGTKAGYVIRARTRIGDEPVLEYVLFGISGDTVTMAAYDRDASVASLPDAVTFVESLCPP